MTSDERFFGGDRQKSRGREKQGENAGRQRKSRLEERQKARTTEQQEERLQHWKKVLARDLAAWQTELNKMDGREALYQGTHELVPVCDAEKRRRRKGDGECSHVRNIVMENIETMIDSTIPAPKVTPLRKCDEELARKIENMLRWKVAQMKLQEINDIAERTVPIQGGAAYLIEWDHALRTHNTVGDLKLTFVHPKMIVPQDGVNTDVEDMDHVAVRLPCTRSWIRRTFGVSVEQEREAAPQTRGSDSVSTEDVVTLEVMLYRAEDGTLGRFLWCGDTVVLDAENYQARKLLRCKRCGNIETKIELEEDEKDEEREISGEDAEKVHRCPYCEGTDFELTDVDEEEIVLPRTLTSAGGKEIDLQMADMAMIDGHIQILQARSKVPYYVPKAFPLILQKNISVFGRLLGDSDVDKIADQQNTIKRIDKKILDRMMTAGTVISLPSDTHIDVDTEDQRVIRLKNAADRQLIGTYEFVGNIANELNLGARIYEETRQMLGVTDSYQGRKDTTATSGTAKQFSAAQAAGRMESKRVLKKLAWSKIYEAMFQNMLAYSDERRQFRFVAGDGKVEYEQWDRWDFLEQDEAGNLYWNDQFIFECDDSSALASNREKMWQEVTAQFQAGALGDPAQTATRVLYWSLMEELHYPFAATIRARVEEQQRMEQQMQMEQAAMQQVQPGSQVPMQTGGQIPGVL